MLIYLCQWSLDKELAKGLGKPKSKEFIRTKIDSRGFTANYLLMDGMKEPLILSDVLRSNILRLNKIFRT